MKTTIDRVKKIASKPEVTAGYLPGETSESKLFKYPVLLNEINDPDYQEEACCTTPLMYAFLA